MESQLLRSYAGRQVASLALYHVNIGDDSVATMKAAQWHNQLLRLGFAIPLFCVRDFGLLLTTTRENASIGPRALLADIGLPSDARGPVASYQRLLAEIAGSDHVRKLASMRLRDDLVAALLVKILADVNDNWHRKNRFVDAQALPLDSNMFRNVDYRALWQHFGASAWIEFLATVESFALHVLTSIELIDVETVRVMGMFRGDDAGGDGAFGQALSSVDLLAALNSPDAHDVASFSLDLLPSILETKRSSGVQSLSIDGYASVERRGNLDSLVLSQLAYDEEVFAQKYVDSELLYFGHERQHEEERRLQYILVDASPSMRGRRQLFARGLALALTKKLLLLGEEVRFRFFDARLHPAQRIARSKDVPVSYLLSFRSELGRNYRHVFSQVLRDVQLLRREQKKQVVLYLITHAQCHAPSELVREIAADASVYGVFVLPSGDDLPHFVEHLATHQVIHKDSMASESSQRDRALEIVSDVAQQVEMT